MDVDHHSTGNNGDGEKSPGISSPPPHPGIPPIPPVSLDPEGEANKTNILHRRRLISSIQLHINSANLPMFSRRLAPGREGED